MCEFAVYDMRDLSRKIAEDIVKATIKEGNLVVRKVLGESLSLENTLVLELDVSKERIIVSQSPLVGNLTKLVGLISGFEKNPTPGLHKMILSLWEKLKSEGDSVVRALNTK